jgi:hypothetical protein
MSEPCNEISSLQTRIEALEARLAVAQSRKRGTLLAVLLAGWALAQTGVTAGQGEQPVGTSPPDDAIRKGPDGITRIDAPFQVVGAGGKVLLDVSADGNTAADVSVRPIGGAGAVTVYSGEGKVLALMGRNNNGWGTVMAFDAGERPRSFVQGNGSVFVNNDADKVVAQMHSFAGTGVIGIWGANQKRIATLSEGAAGAGELTIFDKGHKQVALISTDPNGAGGIDLFAAGKSKPAAGLGISQNGGGQLSLTDASGQPSAFLTGAEGESGNGAVVLVKAGKPLASLSVDTAGKPMLTLTNVSGQPSAILTGADAESGNGAVELLKDGKLRASLSLNTASAGDLWLSNSDGGFGLEAVGTAPKSPSRGGAIAVYNKEGAAVSAMGTDDDGGGIVSIQENSKTFVVLRRDTDHKAGAIWLQNAEGKPGIHASANTGQGGGMSVYNSIGEPVASLASGDGNKGFVTILDKQQTVAEMSGAAGGGSLTLFDAQGKLAFDANGANGGELITLHNGQVTASIGPTSEGRGRIAAYAKNGAVAEIAANQAGGGIVFVRNTANVVVAGMSGTNNTNSGAVVVRDSSGATLAQLGTTPDNRGEVKVVNAAGKLLAVMAAAPEGSGGTMQVSNGNDIVASMTAKSSGYGYLQLLDAGGATMVEAGVTTGGLGAVMTGPGHRCPGGGTAKLAPTCIQGIAGK